jgi:hypothetical protein
VAEDAVKIPTTLRRPHPCVTATSRSVSRARRLDDGRLEIGGRPGVVRLVVSRARARSALLLLQGIFREAERRGWSVLAVKHERYVSAPGVAIQVREHRYPIEIIELTDRVPLVGEELEQWRARAARHRYSWQPEPEPPSPVRVPHGYLRLVLAERYRNGRSNWSAGVRGGLVRKLPSFFAELERRAAEDDRRAEEQRRRQEEWRRQELERMERQRAAQIEQVRVTRLLEEVAAWRRSQDVAEYVAALRSRLGELELEDRERIGAWCEWAEDWRRRTDPSLQLSLVRGLLEEELQPWASAAPGSRAYHG